MGRIPFGTSDRGKISRAVRPGVEVRSGSTSSECGCAGSLRLFVALDVDAVSVKHCATGRVLG